jgi:hypothetical protein
MSAVAPLPDAGRHAPARTVSARSPRSLLSLVPSPIQARRAPFVVLLLVLLAGGLIALLLLNTASAQDAFKLHALQNKEASLAQDMQVYSSMGDGLDNPTTLAARAAALGMIQGDIPVFLAAGAALPFGAIRVGDEAYIPGPPPAVPTPQASPAVVGAPKAAATPKVAVKPKTGVLPKTAVPPKGAAKPTTPTAPTAGAKPATPAVGAKPAAATTKTGTTKTPTATTVGGK